VKSNDWLLWAGIIGVGLALGGKKVYDMTRGLRNNNPGNVRLATGVTWVGQVPPQLQTDSEFVQMTSPEYGIRMMAVILKNYGSKAGLPGYGGPGIDTVGEIIARWAPPSENDTAAYVAAVLPELGLPPTEQGARTALNITQSLPVLIPAIVRHENGLQPYDAATIARGIALAA
jgi:hypothetical protein